jgi:hypothetical protein
MEQGGGHRPQHYRPNFTIPPILRKVSLIFAERQRSDPRVGDI